jgi:hypothetical protein
MQSCCCWVTKFYVRFYGPKQFRQLDVVFDLKSEEGVNGFNNGHLSELGFQEFKHLVRLLVYESELEKAVQREVRAL